MTASNFSGAGSEMIDNELNSTSRTIEKLFTAEQVAAILNVSSAWVYDHTNRKRPVLPSVRLGKAVRFRPDDIVRFINDMLVKVA